jgi:1-acyl-sn-glycerol-3-phosphate acyltransferase
VKWQDFQRQLRETGGYDTPEGSGRSAVDRLFGRVDAYVYGLMFKVVITANWAACRGRFNSEAWSAHSFAMLRAAERSGARMRIRGADRIAGLRQPAVYVSNHMSLMETFVIPGVLLQFGDVATIVKTSLIKYPLFGRVLTSTRPITVTRTDPRLDLTTVLTDGVAALKQGRSLLVFPQSTRRADFRPLEFNSIGLKVAQRADAPMVPVAVKTDYFRNGKWLKDVGPLDRRQTMHIEFGDPIATAARNREAHRLVVDFIAGRLRSWGGAVSG